MAASSAAATVTGPSPVTMQFPLTRSGDSAYAAWIRYATEDGTAIAGSDYTVASGAVEIPAGATSASIPVQIAGASSASPDKQFTLNLLGATGVGPTPDFAAQQTFATGTAPSAVTTADVNGDGSADLIIADASDDSVSVRLNTTAPGAASPSFASGQSFAVNSTPYAVTTADLNGDGRPDLIVAHLGSSNVSVLLNTTAPGEAGATTLSFAAHADFATGSESYAVTAADVNGDGKADLVVANYYDGSVSVLLNTTAPGAASPSFAMHTDFTAGSHPYSVTTADVNGDGMADLIVANASDNTVSVLLNSAAAGALAPSFAAHADFATGSSPNSVTAADMNGDGRPDLIVANLSDSDTSVLLNSTTPGAASPGFAAQQTFATGGNPSAVTTADVNGDGQPDLIALNLGAPSDLVVLENTTVPGATSASFTALPVGITGNYSIAVAVADLNGDGRPDLIAPNFSDDTVSVFLNTTAAPTASAPSFATQQSFAVGSYPLSVTTADVNGDGRPDLIIANSNGNLVSVLLNTTAPGAATPSFAAQQTFA
ncbi:MAG: FG-GAP-like repeat-containing protein, partial [Rhodanobacteraceae bacterium]